MRERFAEGDRGSRDALSRSSWRGSTPGAGGALDPELLVERALALPERKHADDVRDALTALVDYLEFELKNHPASPTPTRSCDAVAPLRATLRG